MTERSTSTSFLALVKHRFERANPDKDGTIDCRELSSLAGAATCCAS